jgi:hypothetical protein
MNEYRDWQRTSLAQLDRQTLCLTQPCVEPAANPRAREAKSAADACGFAPATLCCALRSSYRLSEALLSLLEEKVFSACLY